MQLLLADDEPKVCSALRLLIEEQEDWQMAGEVTDAANLIAKVKQTCPDLVLLDWGLPGKEPSALIAQLLQDCPNLKVVVYSGRMGVKKAALATGADAFVSKVDPPQHLLSVIYLVGSDGRLGLEQTRKSFNNGLTQPDCKRSH